MRVNPKPMPLLRRSLVAAMATALAAGVMFGGATASAAPASGAVRLAPSVQPPNPIVECLTNTLEGLLYPGIPPDCPPGGLL